MARLLLIRHGQASYGQADYDRLSPRGQAQARALGKHLAAGKLDALYVGPHQRHAETLALAREAAQMPDAIALPELAEYPAFELVTKLMPKLLAEDPSFAAPDRAFQRILQAWSRDEWSIEGVERVAEFAARVQRGLDRVVAELRSGARVAIFTSAGPIGVAVGRVFGASELHMVRTSLVVRNASITEIVMRTGEVAWHPERVSLVGFNSIAHLAPELHSDY